MGFGTPGGLPPQGVRTFVNGLLNRGGESREKTKWEGESVFSRLLRRLTRRDSKA